MALRAARLARPARALMGLGPGMDARAARMAAPAAARGAWVRGLSGLSGGPPEVEVGGEQDLKKQLQPLAPQPLADVVKLELLADKTSVELETIWTAYHEEKKSAVGATLSAAKWDKLSHRLDQNPMFVFPVNKGDGAFFVLLAEWKENTLLMTFLEDYQKNPALADPYFYLKAYPEFAEDKNLVLLRGEFLPYLTKAEANDLLDSALDFYLKDDQFQHVQTFNHRSHLFDFNKVFGL